jgi:rhamnogalacturonan endolyase
MRFLSLENVRQHRQNPQIMSSLVSSSGMLLTLFLLLPSIPAHAQRQMENLTRGIVAVKLEDGGVFVGWRLFGTDPDAIAFHLYRATDGGEPVRVNNTPHIDSTNLIDPDADTSRPLEYFIRPVLDGRELPPSKPVRAWDRNYLEIPIQPIPDYRPGDASIADLDGDGEYNIVLHQVSRGRDNSFPGITGTPVLDAYKLDGTHLWRHREKPPGWREERIFFPI